MSDDEEIDELPPIEVDSFSRDASNVSMTDPFEMPAADELASQRERELLCERQLRALPAVRAASSDSDGEAALADALRALRVLPPPPAAPAAADLLAALLPHLPPSALLHNYLDACRRLDDDALAAVTDDMLTHVCALVSCEENAWSGSEVVCVGAWLCVVCVCARGGARVRAARAVRAVAGERAAPAPLAALSRALARAPPAALLPLADAVGDAAQGRLAADLYDAALAHHLALQKEEVSWSSSAEVGAAVARRWGALTGGARYSVVQLAGRRLAAAAATRAAPCADAAALLRALDRAPAPAPAQRHHPEHLKVSVGVSKLQLLFGPKN